MEKPIVLYRNGIQTPLVIGEGTAIFPINHPNTPRVSNERIAYTSQVVSIGEDGVFETMNTIYKPEVPLMKRIEPTDHAQVKAVIQPNKWTHATALTEEQVTALSDSTKHDLTEMGDSYKYITCDTCCLKATCTFAFDIYNTDGDCLLK